MNRQVLFIQGAGVRVHDEWDNKLVESLTRALGPQYVIRYPRMPGEEDPHFAAWKVTLQQQFEELDDGAIVVGHSVGGTMLINTLAEQPPPVVFGAIILMAAPFIGEGGWQSNDWQPSDGLGKKLPGGVPIYLYYGLDDETVPLSHVELYAKAIPQAQLCRLPGRDHQLNNDLREIAGVIKSLAGQDRPQSEPNSQLP